MAHFIVRLSVFLLAQAAIIGSFEHGLASISNSYTRKQQIMNSMAPRAEMIVLGSSYSLHGIDPDVFGVPTVNLANTSQDFYYNAKIVDRCIADLGARPRAVLLEVAYVSL